MRLKIIRCLYILLVFATCFSVLWSLNEDQNVNWPSFRGLNARGYSDGQATPVNWNIENNSNIEWKTEIPGLAHSSPVILGDRIFITTAISEKEKPELKNGLYGSITPVEENYVHQWKVYCLDTEMIVSRVGKEKLPLWLVS